MVKIGVRVTFDCIKKYLQSSSIKKLSFNPANRSQLDVFVLNFLVCNALGGQVTLMLVVRKKHEVTQF